MHNISYIRLLGRNTNHISYIENIHNNRLSTVYIFLLSNPLLSIMGNVRSALHRMVYTVYVNHHPDTGKSTQTPGNTQPPPIAKPTHHHSQTPTHHHTQNPHTPNAPPTHHPLTSCTATIPATTPRPHHAPSETPARTAPADPGWLTAQPQTDSARHGPRRPQNSPHHPHARRGGENGEARRGEANRETATGGNAGTWNGTQGRR